jgi:hypothetical protein
MDANLSEQDRSVVFVQRDSLIFSPDCDIIMVNLPATSSLCT